MTNKYLEKIASDHMIRGMISPAWQQNAIAKDHGHSSAGNWGQALEKHVGGDSRQAMRSGVEGAVTGAIGGAVSRLATLNNPSSAKITRAVSGASAVIGSLHGWYKSTKNQAAEAHKKYSE